MSSPEARPIPDIPWLFDGYGLAVLLAATLLATTASAVHVAFLAGALLVLGLAARVWAYYSLDRLGYSRRTLPPRAFCGDTLVLETVLGNRKLLPLPWLEVWERLPAGLTAEGETERSAEWPGASWLCQGAALWPYQRARWRHRVHCYRRGVYALKGAVARSGDPFGVCERQRWLAHTLELVVYPRVVPLRRLALAPRHASMDVSSRASLVADPTRAAGVRDYRPGDPQRLIHWRATAHAGRLQVRVLERTTSLQVWLVVDAGSFDLPWQLYRDNLFELALSAVASIAVYLHQAGSPVGLLAYASPAGEVPPSANPAQLQALLEALARLEPRAALESREAALARLPRGSAVILAASDAARDLSTSVFALEQAGHQVQVLLCGHGAPGDPPPPGQFLRLVPGGDLAAALEGRA